MATAIHCTSPGTTTSGTGTRAGSGIVSKRVDCPCASGPTKDWIKVKCPEWRETNVWRHEFFAEQK
jgi:hypothetical protein